LVNACPGEHPLRPPSRNRASHGRPATEGGRSAPSPAYTVGKIIAWFAQHYPKIKASSVRAHIKGLTANDPSRRHYQVSGRSALFMRQPDKTLMPYDDTAVIPQL
jgi:hypothetical protein